jgi:regulator of RNase E activity RraA
MSKSTRSSQSEILKKLRATTVSSLSDAAVVLGRGVCLSHEMRPRVAGNFAGRATTALLVPVDRAGMSDAEALHHSIALFDGAGADSVGVFVLNQGLEVAALGGLMATVAKARGMVGVVVDGGVRDIAEIRALNLPVYSRSVVPARSPGRFAGVSHNDPVYCAGVMVVPGDYIVANEDGVVSLPAARAAEIAAAAADIDKREQKMLPVLRKHKSLRVATEKFKRA